MPKPNAPVDVHAMDMPLLTTTIPGLYSMWLGGGGSLVDGITQVSPRNIRVRRFHSARSRSTCCGGARRCRAPSGTPRDRPRSRGAARVFPDESLQRQVDADGLIGLHEWRSRPGIPKISSSVGRSDIPTDAAPAAWSMRAKTVTALARSAASRRSVVTRNELSFRRLTRPVAVTPPRYSMATPSTSPPRPRASYVVSTGDVPKKRRGRRRHGAVWFPPPGEGSDRRRGPVPSRRKKIGRSLRRMWLRGC